MYVALIVWQSCYKIQWASLNAITGWLNQACTWIKKSQTNIYVNNVKKILKQKKFNKLIS